MAITTADILLKRSVNTGPGNSAAQPNQGDSLGGFMSTTQVPDATANNIFDDLSGDENAAGVVEHRCIFVHNNHATNIWFGVRAWMAADAPGGSVYAIALDGTGITPAGSANAQAERVANERTAPAGEAFSAPTTKATGLLIGDMAPGTCAAIWVRRTAQNSAPLNADNFQIGIGGDTAE